ncbi:MAG: DUF1329 domain-containing protein [Pseudomonadota bacterium]
MKYSHQHCVTFAIALCLAAASHAAVTPEEAAALKTTLTPMGGELAGNRDGTIPAWTGGLEASPASSSGRRADPFAADRKLYSISSKNMAEYEGKLSEGSKALFKKYPDSFRIDVYPTRRSASAPRWVYDNTFKNATRGKLSAALVPQDVYGGIPFPIPKSGAEVMWNSLLMWRGQAWTTDLQAFLSTADGQNVMTVDARTNLQMPYYFQNSSLEKFNGEYLLAKIVNSGPAIRAGEAFVGRVGLDDSKSRTWLYLTGQRRVRRLPNSCCDTPSPASAGVMSFDEIGVYGGSLERFNWKIVGKKEMLVPYNANRILAPNKSAAVLSGHHFNPDYVRWELHRMWVVEATLASGQRHTAHRSVYYVDEDSWMAVLGDRYDAQGKLWKTLFQLPVAINDLPGVVGGPYGFADLLSGTGFVAQLWNDKNSQYRIQPPLPDSAFTADTLAGEGVR